MSFSSRWTVVLFAGFSLVAGACKCGGDQISPLNACQGVSGVQADNLKACSSSADCSDHFSCQGVKERDGVQCCVFGDRKCTTEADCCPGQTCIDGRNRCFDKYLSCETDADCGDKGDRFCEVYTDSYGSSSRCRFKTCGSLGSCPTGQSCFQGECMAELPCGGTCAAGSGCVPSNDRCQDYSAPTDRPTAACPMSCAPGFLATFADTRNIWDACTLTNAKCVCAELPGLVSEDLGRFSALSFSPAQGLFASQYDGQYGDLVVARYDTAGKPLGLEYVDGVPNGMPTYGPNGARGGVVEPGDDVGRYSDIVATTDSLYVSYYDATRGDLKFATRSGGTWATHTVDGTTADVGLYASLALDSDGVPGIAYFQRSGDATFDPSTCPTPAPTGNKQFITALKFAKAKTPKPGSVTDWTVKTLACQSRSVPACFGCTGICADTGTGPSCQTAATDCTTCDAATETCVKASATAAGKCGKKYNPANLQEVPEGVGVFTSLAFNGKDAYVAYMRRGLTFVGSKLIPDGDLYGMRIAGSTTASAAVPLDTAGDTGYFPEVKIDPTSKNVAVAYHDFTSRRLKYLSAPGFATGLTPETIDPGTGTSSSGDNNWVGTDTALVFAPTGTTVYAVYQDATHADLKLARRGTASWVVQKPVATAGSLGYFADAVFADGKLFASHARIHSRLVKGEPRVNNSLVLETVPLP